MNTPAEHNPDGLFQGLSPTPPGHGMIVAEASWESIYCGATRMLPVPPTPDTDRPVT